jgi:hypothetical protein
MVLWQSDELTQELTCRGSVQPVVNVSGAADGIACNSRGCQDGLAVDLQEVRPARVPEASAPVPRGNVLRQANVPRIESTEGRKRKHTRHRNCVNEGWRSAAGDAVLHAVTHCRKNSTLQAILCCQLVEQRQRRQRRRCNSGSAPCRQDEDTNVAGIFLRLAE